ncbi:lipase class 3 [Perkinsela sp. CCAP 1560/4]|nr:lipase class 3 [Perkinsela sp. CCAP 1560/4]|eukprot:KNH07048.1 lipase class 3 [Perkinsela sp. CCAP 1560/4]
MSKPLQLYRTMLKAAIEVDESKMFLDGASLEDLVKSRGRFLFEMPLEGSHSYEVSLLARTQKAEAFISSMEQLRKNNPAHPFLSSAYHAMLSGKGDYYHRKTLEDGVILFMTLQESPEYRQNLDESHLGDRQNRVLQKAISHYSERLAHIHNGQYDPVDATIKTTMLDLPEKVLVEIHDDQQKQTIYIDTESSLDASEVEGAQIVELEKLPECLVHRSIFSRAQRVFEAVLAETDLHRSRKTYIIGHGLGGAIATVLGLLLIGEQFEITNTITLGSQKSVETVKQRYVDRLNCMRVVIPEDPQISLPINSERHRSFLHFGETLMLHPERPGFTVDDYNNYLSDPSMPLSYSETLDQEETNDPLSSITREKRSESGR